MLTEFEGLQSGKCGKFVQPKFFTVYETGYYLVGGELKYVLKDERVPIVFEKGSCEMDIRKIASAKERYVNEKTFT